MSGYLKYTDTSTGQMVAELPTRLGAPTSLAQNPWNAILHVGHQNGTVTLWSPNSQTRRGVGVFEVAAHLLVND
jgi:U3 small nucleolar RNA-associated protein 7